jgi:A118 family predicted phage portal protein
VPLPAENTAWPPPPWDFAYKAYDENEAWYLGDVDRLEKLYRLAERERPSHVVNGRPMRGGVAGLASRFFWGRPVPYGQSRTRIHVPAPADLATLSSDLIFSEPPKIRLGEDGAGDKKAAARLDLIANSDEAHATFNTMGELKAALGATAITSVWDTEVSDHVWLEVSAADVIIPEFRRGKLVACTMWTQWVDGQTYWRHLERHEVGAITHALYRGSQNNLGKRVALQARPETEYLANVVDGDGRILTGIDRLTCSYNLNMPTRAWRKRGDLAYTGRSDFAGLHGLFDALDEAFSSWMRDLKLAGGKIVVPEAALQSFGPGSGQAFDLSQEVFLGLNMPGDPNKPGAFDKIQFEIRVQEHQSTVLAIYREILRASGYSQSAWGDYAAGSPNQGAQTATEVQDRDKASERTRDKKILYDKQALARQSSVALELDGLLFPGKGGGRFDEPDVMFADAAQQDPEKRARVVQMLDAARAASTKRRVELANPDWDDEQVKTEVDLILAEEPKVADPTFPPFAPAEDPADA